MRKYLETLEYNRRLDEVLEKGDQEEIVNLFDEYYTTIINKTLKKQIMCEDIPTDYRESPASLEIKI